MVKTIPAIQYAQQIQQLVDERKHHVDALSRIDQMLANIGAALGGMSTHTNGKPARATEAVAKAPAAPRKRRRGRGHFEVSAEASILAFVKAAKNATSGEINAHLVGEGRSASANNALGKLVKEKMLKREPLKDQRGSRYLLV